MRSSSSSDGSDGIRSTSPADTAVPLGSAACLSAVTGDFALQARSWMLGQPPPAKTVRQAGICQWLLPSARHDHSSRSAVAEITPARTHVKFPVHTVL